MFQNKLRLIYNDGLGLGLDMTKNELSQIIIEEIDKLSTLMEPLAILFQQIHRRFRNRLGFN
jgi:nitrogen-specific signal transduction histidine kinase